MMYILHISESYRCFPGNAIEHTEWYDENEKELAIRSAKNLDYLSVYVENSQTHEIIYTNKQSS